MLASCCGSLLVAAVVASAVLMDARAFQCFPVAGHVLIIQETQLILVHCHNTRKRKNPHTVSTRKAKVHMYGTVFKADSVWKILLSSVM